ncbi:MAG: AMP-binding protein [Pseudomonadota bacterium]
MTDDAQITSLETLARAAMGRTVLVTKSEQISGEVLAAWSVAFAEALAGLALTTNHRIATRLRTGPRAALVHLLLSERASVLPINPALTPQQQREILDAAEPDIVLSEPDWAQEGDWVLSPESLPSLKRAGPLPLPKYARTPGLVLLTSGSTGAPKRVPLTRAALTTSAQTIAQTLELSAHDRALHALPSFHIGAVVDLLLSPLIAGGAVIFADGPGPEELAAAIRQHRPTWLQLVPTMASNLLAHFGRSELQELGASLRFIRSVSADMSPGLQARVEEAFGCPVIQMYGMTETAGQIASNPLPPAVRKPGSVGKVAGPEVCVMDRVGTPVAQGGEGEVCVRGPTVMAGYEGLEVPDAAFGNWLRTGDLGRFDGDGYLWLTGRLKEQINRGGEKVSPLEVERAALEAAGVTQACAYALPHATLGEQIGLSIAGEIQVEALQAGLTARLPEFMVPHAIKVVAEFPRLGSGKIDRVALRAAHLAESKGETPLVERTGLSAKIATAWEESLGKSPANEDDFFERGGDSLMAVTFLARLEELLSRVVDANTLLQAPRFAAFVAAVEATGVAADRPPSARFVERAVAAWPGQRALPGGLIKLFGPPGEGLPLFYCNQGGGEFERVKAALAPHADLFILRSLFKLTGKNDAETEVLARHYAAEMMAIQPEGAFRLAGFCEGGKVMEFAARALAQAGRDVAEMTLIDHWPLERIEADVRHVWTAQNSFSAGWMWPEAEGAVAEVTGAAVSVLRLGGRHHAALTSETFAAIAAAPWGGEFEQFARPERLRARIAVSGPRIVRPGKSGRFVVKIINDGAEAIAPSDESGVFLRARITSLGGTPKHRLPLSFGRIVEPIASGARQSVSLDVTLPERRRPFGVTFDLVEVGKGRPRDDGLAVVRRWVWPLG